MFGLLMVIALGMLLQATPSDPRSQLDETKAEVLGHGYSRDGDFIYFNKQRIDQAGKEDVDRFAKSANLKLSPCADVDAASFKALSEEYTKDKNKVYYKWISNGRFWIVELPLADAKSFEVIDSNLAKTKIRFGGTVNLYRCRSEDCRNCECGICLEGCQERLVSENKDFQRRCKDVPAP